MYLFTLLFPIFYDFNIELEYIICFIATHFVTHFYLFGLIWIGLKWVQQPNSSNSYSALKPCKHCIYWLFSLMELRGIEPLSLIWEVPKILALELLIFVTTQKQPTFIWFQPIPLLLLFLHWLREYTYYKSPWYLRVPLKY